MKTIITLLSIFMAFMVNAQDFQGKAYYFSKTGMDMDFGGRQMSEERKKEMANRMKSALEKTFILTFNTSAASYKEETTLETGDEGGGRRRMMFVELASSNYYKNIKTAEYYDQREFYGKNFLIKDSLSKYNWTLVNETKKIGNYTCFKATTTRKSSEFMDWREMRRKAREQRSEEEGDKTGQEKKTKAPVVPKEIEVVAWYTPEIPVNQGPKDYWGLPGLILEVQEGKTTLLCNKIILNPEEKEEVKPPTKGKKVSQSEFDVIAKKKIEEMIEQFSTQRRGNFGGRRN